MKILTKIIEVLKPFKDILTIVIALGTAAYAAVSYFATADQLARTQASLARKLDSQMMQNRASMEEITCLNQHNRALLQVQIEEVGLRAILDKNVERSERFKLMDSEAARIEFAGLQASMTTHIERMSLLANKRADILAALQIGACSANT